ncbi:MAG: aminotransferase class I/II-fold pyridoxal phosphate-dependent enzyme, partial [Pseudomonadota bacterium]|nr:aminotransferase class I/II-fold pyridoxal phosphate-dependent enzyme [Pseudomonadota bacterium]
MQLNTATPEQLRQWESELLSEYENLKQQQLNLDLTRGKPSSDQLSLSDALDGILKGDYTAADGTDTRNYGGLDGIGEAKALGAELLGVNGDEILVGGNSSLTLMYLSAQTAFNFGLNGPDSAWNKQEKVKFLCPVPGYDRHFSICEQLGIEMVTVPMLSDGPDMDVVEQLIKDDSSIRGMWCVPKYSNPTGIIYSDATVDRIAQLGNIASPDFRVFWDNAYAVHDLNSEFEELANIMEACRKHGTENSVLQFCSTSKITQAGAGISFMGASSSNLSAVKKVLSIQSIGPDKVNQLRHLRFLPNKEAVLAHMQKHAALLRPRFEC